MPSTKSYYQFIIIYRSKNEDKYAYEVNLSEEQAINITEKIEKRAPSLRFDGRTIFPRRISLHRIYLTESPYPRNSQSLHNLYPGGYKEDFDGKEVTREISSKIQARALMSGLIEDWIKNFNETLEYVTWNRDLAKHIQDYLNAQNFSSSGVDKLLMVITKLVEANLRDAVQRFTGATVPPGKHYGIQLLNYTRTQGLIPEPKRGTGCLYYLIFWFFSNPRNVSHHTFTKFPLPTLFLFISSANYILDEVNRLSKGKEIYDAKFDVSPLPENKLLVKVYPVVTGSKSAKIRNLHVLLSAPNKSITKIPLRRDENVWETQIDTFGYEKGTYRIDLAGYSDAGEKLTLSGSTIVLFPIHYSSNV